MKIVELSPSIVQEKINPEITTSDFHAEKDEYIQDIGPIKFIARKILPENPPQFRVDVMKDDQNLAYFRFVVVDYEQEPKFKIFSKFFGSKKDPYVIGGNISVRDDYQRKGIASKVYQWVRSMGNDIKPSPKQTAAGKAMWRGFEKNKTVDEARVSTEPKELTQVDGSHLQGLLGKGAFNSLMKHPWMSDWSAYKKAWKHGVSRAGFHIVEMYPYMEEVHSVEGGIRPEHKLVFGISHFGPSGKVVQVHKWHRPKEPNEQEKKHGPSAGWKHVKSWKNEKDELSELKKSKTYPKPIGMMEMFKFMQIATTDQKNELKKLMSSGMQDAAWKLLQAVTDTTLSEVAVDEAEARTPASIEIRKSLRNGGYKLLGSGADATVWAKKEGPVIKIIMPDDGKGAGVAGDTFMKFYEFCKEHPNYENLPKFADNEVDVFESDGKQYIMVTMERLSPIPKGSFQEAMVWLLSDLATENMSWESAEQVINDEQTWIDYEGSATPEQILGAWDQLDLKDKLQYEILFKLMTLLWHKGRINKVGWDLHTENAMMRDDTIVITDPWFNSNIK